MNARELTPSGATELEPARTAERTAPAAGHPAFHTALGCDALLWGESRIQAGFSIHRRKQGQARNFLHPVSAAALSAFGFSDSWTRR